MIHLMKEIPNYEIITVEQFKIKANFSLYSDKAVFWKSDNGGMISYLDWDAVITGNFDSEELNGFLHMTSPLSVFCNSEMAKKIKIDYKRENVCVVSRSGKISGDYPEGDNLKSDEIYKTLKVDGLNLPPQDSFSLDFCMRLNHGALCYYAEKDRCAAIGLLCEDTCLITGLASREKGLGTKALNAVIKKANKKYVLAVCREELLPFYIKNGFKKEYDAVYLTR